MATKEKKDKKLAITLTRGLAAADKKQTKVLEALGLRRSQKTVYHNDGPTIMGMINKVSHLVEVKENK